MTQPDIKRMSHPMQATAPEPVEKPVADTGPVKNTAAHAAPGSRPIAAAAELLRDSERKFRQHLDSINPQPYTPQGLQERISAFSDSPAAAQIDEATRLVAEREEQAAKRVAEVMAGLSPEGGVADELRSTRACNRAQRTLDAASDAQVGEVARQLIANASDSELGVLLTELPSLLATRGQDSSCWIEEAVAQRVPELAAAREQLKLSTQAKPCIEYDAQRLRKRIANTPTPKAYDPVLWVDVSAYDPDA